MSVSHQDIAYLPASELTEHYRNGGLSPIEVTTALLKRIEQVNPSLNAIVTATPDLALEQARVAEDLYRSGEGGDRPLLGVPFTVKDNIATKGIRTTMGSLLTENLVPDFDAPAVERSYDAGGIMLGKTNTPEVGWKGETTNRVFGSTYNPWDLELTPGGSTGGGAAAVAAGLCPLALGTDGGGSIRIPASFCGIFGFKGSFGLIPVVPNGALETLPHVGVLARTVRDGALYVDALAGPDARDRLSLNETGRAYAQTLEQGIEGFRCAWSPDLGYATADPEILELTGTAAQALEEAGATVEEIQLELADPYPVFEVFFSAGMAGAHAHDFDEVRDRIDFGRAQVVEDAFTTSIPHLGAALLQRSRFTEQMRVLMESYDVLLTPTMPLTPFRAGMDSPATAAGEPLMGLSWSPYTYPMNLTGQPACSVPCGLTAGGLPVGLQITGRWRGDESVLRTAAAFEAVRPWRTLRPAIGTDAQVG